MSMLSAAFEDFILSRKVALCSPETMRKLTDLEPVLVPESVPFRLAPVHCTAIS